MNLIRNALQSAVDRYISYRWEEKIRFAWERFGHQENAAQAIFDNLLRTSWFFKDSKMKFVCRLKSSRVQVVASATNPPPAPVAQEQKPTASTRTRRPLPSSTREFKGKVAKGMLKASLTMPFAQAGYHQMGSLVSTTLFPISKVDTFQITTKSDAEYDFAVTMTKDQKAQLTETGRKNLSLSRMNPGSPLPFSEIEQNLNFAQKLFYYALQKPLAYFNISLNKTIKVSVKYKSDDSCEVTFEPNQIVGDIAGLKKTLLCVSCHPIPHQSLGVHRPLKVTVASVHNPNDKQTLYWTEKEFTGVFKDLTWER